MQQGPLQALTEHEQNQYSCADLLPDPGPEVVRGLLEVVNDLRTRIARLCQQRDDALRLVERGTRRQMEEEWGLE